jgi:hypothetical protein
VITAFIKIIATVMAEVVLVTDKRTADVFWGILEEGWQKMRAEGVEIGIAYMTCPRRWFKNLDEYNRKFPIG